MLTARRFIIYSITFSLRRFVTETNHWCTGKDSNLRTSLGGTDLQSVGFNHSPTCAQSPGDAALALHPADNFTRHARQLRIRRRHVPLFAPTDEPMQNRLLPIRETKIRAYGIPREDHYTPE